MSSYYYEHQEHSSPEYRDATEAYRSSLVDLSGPEPVRRGVAYLAAIDVCRKRHGDSSAQVAAAFYYFSKWLSPVAPRRAVEATLALLDVERETVGAASTDMQGTMQNLALASFALRSDPRLDVVLAGEVASRFAIALSRAFEVSSGEAELNLGHCLYEAGEHLRAAAWLEVGIERTHDDPKRVCNALRTRAFALYKGGEYEASDLAYQRALPILRSASHPGAAVELAIALYQLSFLLEAMGEMSAAAEAVVACERVEYENDLFRDNPRERELTQKRRVKLEQFRHLPDPDDEIEPDDGEPDDAVPDESRPDVAWAREEGGLWTLNCQVAKLEVEFDAGRLNALLDDFLGILRDCSFTAMQPPSDDVLTLAPELERMTIPEPRLDDELLLATAVHVRDFLLRKLPGRPDRELADAVAHLEALLQPLMLPWVPFPSSFELPRLDVRASEAIELQLRRIRRRAAITFEREPYLRTHCTAEAWISGRALADVHVGDRTAVVELRDHPVGVLDELQHLLDFPNTIALSLFGDELTEGELLAFDFAALENLRYLDLAQNQLEALPRSIATHPSIEWLCLRANPFLEIGPDEIAMPNLRSLDLRGCRVSSEVVAELRSRMPGLEVWS